MHHGNLCLCGHMAFSLCLCPISLFLWGYHHWMRAHLNPVWLHLNLITSPRTLFPDKVTFTDTGEHNSTHNSGDHEFDFSQVKSKTERWVCGQLNRGMWNWGWVWAGETDGAAQCRGGGGGYRTLEKRLWPEKVIKVPTCNTLVFRGQKTGRRRIWMEVIWFCVCLSYRLWAAGEQQTIIIFLAAARALVSRGSPYMLAK